MSRRELDSFRFHRRLAAALPIETGKSLGVLAAIGASLWWVSGCSGTSSGYRLPSGANATELGRAAVGLAPGADLARGRLTYALAWSDAHTLAAIELGLSFELVVREVGDARSGRPAREVIRIELGPAEYDVEDIAVHGPRKQVFVAGRDGRVRGFDARTGQLVATWVLGSPATAVAVTGDGAYVATGTADGILCLRRYRDGALIQCVAAHSGQISALQFSPDGDQLVSGSFTGDVIRWRMPGLAEIHRRTFPGAVCDLAFAPDGRRLAAARSAFALRQKTASRPGAAGARASAHPGHAISVWQLADRQTRDLLGHRGPVTSVAWSPDGQRLLSSSWDRTVRLWAVPDALTRPDPGGAWGSGAASELARYGQFVARTRDVAVSADGRHVAVAAWTDGHTGSATALLDLLYPRPATPR